MIEWCQDVWVRPSDVEHTVLIHSKVLCYNCVMRKGCPPEGAVKEDSWKTKVVAISLSLTHTYTLHNAYQETDAQCWFHMPYAVGILLMICWIMSKSHWMIVKGSWSGLSAIKLPVTKISQCKGSDYTMCFVLFFFFTLFSTWPQTDIKLIS